MKKFLLSLIAFTILFKTLYFCFVNKIGTLSFYCPLMNKTIDTNLAIYTLLTFVSGIIFWLCLSVIIKKGKDLNSYKNQYEKVAVQKEEEADKVKILEEKIKSLEIALKRALEK